MPDITYLEERLDLYREKWKTERDIVAECYELEDALVRGIWLYDLLTELEREWRRAVDEGLHVSNQDEVDRLNRLWAWWREPCDSAVASIAHFRHKRYVVDGAKKFLEICAEARRHEPITLPDWQIAIHSTGGILFGKPARTEDQLRQMTGPSQE